MNDKISIRVATIKDILDLTRLYHEMHNFHAAAVSDRLVRISEVSDIHERSDLYQEIMKIIQSMDSVIFLAEVDQKPVGLAEIHIRHDDANPLTVPYRYGYLQSLIVTASNRQRGIGTQLVAAIEHWAKEKGASEIRLNVFEFAGGPLTFYEQLGYRTLKRSLVHRLFE
jgi:GNAT superfamily N-acetyltransferase